MLLVEGFLKIAPDKVSAARPVIADLVKQTKTEDGCIDYSFAEDLSEPGTLRFCERWRDQAALDAHMGAPHFKAFGKSLRDFGIAGPPTIRVWKAEEHKKG